MISPAVIVPLTALISPFHANVFPNILTDNIERNPPCSYFDLF